MLTANGVPMFRTQLGQSNGFLSLKINEFIDRSSAYNITGTKAEQIASMKGESQAASKGEKNGK